ncbi:MAG: glycosyltransferase [Anaerolineales bacterium]|nr:glycosyltransferase [Anaerolineales bacterium]
MKRILLGCYEVPGYGGAATSCYRLFRNLQRDGFEVAYLNLIDQEDVDYFRFMYGDRCGNPEQLENVHNCVLQAPLFYPHPELADMLENLSPALLLGDGYIAALLMKRAYPAAPMIFYTAGLTQVTRFLAGRPKKSNFLGDFKRRASRPPCLHPREKEAFESSDFIVTHAGFIRDLIRQIFPMVAGKVYSNIIWRAEWIVQDARDHAALAMPFDERDIDLIFIASSWQRPEKNFQLVNKIVSRNRRLNIHIVGATVKQLDAATHHGLIVDRRELFALLGRSKTLVCPSLFDAAPGVLFEASAMGCNVVASKKCGNWQLCNPALLVDLCSSRDLRIKITRSLTRKYNDNLDFFINTHSYDDLINIMGVFLDGMQRDSKFPFRIKGASQLTG